MAAGKPQRQAVAIAYSVKRKAKADGGPIGVPFARRSEAHAFSAIERGNTPAHMGPIHGIGGGRADTVPMKVKGGSYVIPADVVSSVGQGNSLAGSDHFNKLFKMGPYGSAPASVKAPKPHFADGGMADGDPGVDIAASDGEYVVPPQKVQEVGQGHMESGHNILDQMVLNIRKHSIKTLRKMKPPKKS